MVVSEKGMHSAVIYFTCNVQVQICRVFVLFSYLWELHPMVPFTLLIKNLIAVTVSFNSSLFITSSEKARGLIT